MMAWVTMVFGKLLNLFYAYTGDYGMAVVCLTAAVKLVLLPFYIKQQKGMESGKTGTGSCLVLLLTVPILTGLYRCVLLGAGGAARSRLCPWAGSLLARDPYGILPVLSAAVQLIPQLYPYLAFFEGLKLPRAPKGMLLSGAVMALIVCVPLPAVVSLYYLSSGIFTALEQAVWNGIRAYRLRAV